MTQAPFIAGDGTETADAAEVMLLQRAKALAVEPHGGQDGEELFEALFFVLASETYALGSSYIREVYPVKSVTPLPGTPDHVLGIINVRGEIISVLDLKRFFDLPNGHLAQAEKVIVLQSEEMEFAVAVDRVIEARPVNARELLPSLPTLTGIRAAYLKGVTKDREVVLDAEKLLHDETIIVNHQKRF